MLRKRQSGIVRPGKSDAQIVTLARNYTAGHLIPVHFHHRDQLVFASMGVMTIRTGRGTWVVPAHRAVWIPAFIRHSVSMSGSVSMRTLYFRPHLAKALPRDCCVINVPPLLRELILSACAVDVLRKRVGRQRHLIDVILDQLEVVQMVALQLPHLSDPRAARIANALMADPSDRRTLAQFCKLAGASKRTLERLFAEEAKMTFGKWRQQLRLMEAMRLLWQGEQVTRAALEAGYSTPSAFIAMFRKALGTPPTSYFRATRTS